MKWCPLIFKFLPLVAAIGAPASNGTAQEPAGAEQDKLIREQLRSLVGDRAAAAQRRAPGVSKVAGTESRTVSHLGVDRTYWIHFPKGEKPAEPVPLILALHGAFTDGPITEELTQLSPLSDREGFCVVYPNADPEGRIGLWEFWGFSVENPGEGEPGQRRFTYGRDDVGYLSALLDTLIAKKIADPSRIFVTGISNGAFMTNRLSIELGDRIAAIAPVAGTGLKLGADQVRAKRAMPVLYMHGTEDEFVGEDGFDFFSKGRHSVSAEAFVDWWAKTNGCSTEVKIEKLPDKSPSDGCRVERRTHPAGPKGAPVIFYRIFGGGHTWPGGTEHQPEALLGKVCRDIDASALMWNFFSRHPLPDSSEE